MRRQPSMEGSLHIWVRGASLLAGAFEIIRLYVVDDVQPAPWIQQSPDMTSFLAAWLPSVRACGNYCWRLLASTVVSSCQQSGLPQHAKILMKQQQSYQHLAWMPAAVVADVTD